MSESRKENSLKPRIDFHVHMGLYSDHKAWVSEWIQQSYSDPAAYAEYIKRNPE